MAANRKEVDELGPSAAHGKLKQLLDTETELDAMLRQTRIEAGALVELAHAEAEDRIRKFESELDAAGAVLRERIAGEREEAVTAIRAEAMRTVEELGALDEQRIEELARYVAVRVAGPVSGGRS